MAARGVDFKWYDGFFLSMLATSVLLQWLSDNSLLSNLLVWTAIPLIALVSRVGIVFISYVCFLIYVIFRVSFRAPRLMSRDIPPGSTTFGCQGVQVIVSFNWKRYHTCVHPLHIWIVVDYTTVFVFRLLMFVDNGLAAGMGLDFGWQQRYARFCGRIVVLSVLALLLYPFLWVWTAIGTLWFREAHKCLPEQGQKWGFLIWLLFSYCALLCIACMSLGKWLTRRQALLIRAQQGIPVSEYGVLVDMIRVPDWAFEAAGVETRAMGQDAATYHHHPGLYLTPAQREAVEALIEDLPKFRLKAVPTDCSECPICLEEFHVGNEVRGLPCAHNFHVGCIDEWLRLNVKCPRCRCSVFPNLDLSALSNLHSDTDRPSASIVTANPYMRSHPLSQSYLVRLQGLLRPVRTGTRATHGDLESAHPLEAAENAENLPASDQTIPERSPGAVRPMSLSQST